MAEDPKIPTYAMGTDNSDLELNLGRANATLSRSLAKPEDLEIPTHVTCAMSAVMPMLPRGTDFADPEMLGVEAASATQASLNADTGIYRVQFPTFLGG